MLARQFIHTVYEKRALIERPYRRRFNQFSIGILSA
jgi:hypothetical protein